jgi:glycosyltransferase involved in cell wall biosynthesis
MRIALVAPIFESIPPRLYGGTERVIHALSRGLTELDHEVVLFASGDSTIEGRVIPVIDEALWLREKPVYDANAYNIRMLKLVGDRADEFDIIHNHHDYWMLPLVDRVDTPMLTTLHGRLDFPDIPAAFLSYPRANYVSISDAQREPLSALNWVRTVHHGIDLSQFAFQPRPGKYLAFLGRLSIEKRPDWAIEIAKKSGVPLKIAAKIDPEQVEYFETCLKPHIDGRHIQYVGEITDHEKSEFLGNALALVFPIDWPEPFGLVLLESLACGTPILARPRGSVPELLRDGVTGFIDAGVDTLARRVQSLDRIDRRGCRRWVEERFSLARMTEDYIHVYRELAARGRRWTSGHRRHLLHSV